MIGCLINLPQIDLDPRSDVPLYKQLAESVRTLVDRGAIAPGDRLPATRELAGRLGLNRTTISAAYAMLEQTGLLEGHVGRGSFIARSDRAVSERSLSDRSSSDRSSRALPDGFKPAENNASESKHGLKPGSSHSIAWDDVLPPLEVLSAPARNISISFASSCPAGEAFPLDEFRRLSKEVIDSPEAAQILQLGSPHGYAPLRRYLLEGALAGGMARGGDDLMITNGCQQALDLIARLFSAGSSRGVVIEDPVYRGIIRVFARTGAALHAVPMDEFGIELGGLQEIIQQHRPRLLVVTPSFQNPTGATLPLERRKRLVEMAQRHGLILVENDIYSELRYQGKPLPTLKELDESGSTILLRSYSKVSFPGLRVGWVIAPRPVIARLAEVKQTSDLHSDQLSQAVLLRFAESGELARHLELTRAAGTERLRTMLRGCARYLPTGSRFTRPEGGMSLWVDLPAPFTAEALLRQVEQLGVDFLPGSFFSAQPNHFRSLRLSFGGLSPQQILRGLQLLGEAAASEPAAALEPVAASV